MARPKTEEMLRHESTDEDSFLTEDERKSGFVAIAQPPQRTGKGKRSLEDMMASRPDDASQAVYAMERIAALEDTIDKIINELATPGAREIILKTRPSLRRFVKNE